MEVFSQILINAIVAFFIFAWTFVMVIVGVLLFSEGK
jgi:hypothetical protein